jgi:hypothetical protein
VDDEQALELVRELMDNITPSENYRLRVLFAEMMRGRGAACGEEFPDRSMGGSLKGNKDRDERLPVPALEKAEMVMAASNKS